MIHNCKKIAVRTRTAEVFLFLLCMLYSIVFAPSVYSETLTLPAGLKLVTENSRIIKITRHEEQIAEADTLIAQSRSMPVINVSGGYTLFASQPGAIFGTQQVPVSEKNFLSYSLSVQQTLYDFRENASRYEASKKLLNAKKYDTARIRNLVAIDFVLVYLDLLETEDLLRVAEKEVERLDSHLRDARNLYQEGVITKNDLLQAEVKISDAKQRLLSVRNFRTVTASRLNNILARPLTSDIQVEDIRDVSPCFVETDRELAWKAAERLRPEIQIAEETLKALDFDKAAKKSGYYPKLFLRGGYDYTENRYQVHEGNWSVMLGMGINLFRGGETRAEVSKIESERMRLIEKINKLLDDIKLEVEKYLLDAKTAKERVDVTRGAVEQAEENLRINRIKYAEGVGTAAEVLDAVTLLTVAETNYFRSLYDLKKAEAAVLYALGKDLLEVYN